eukprot:1189754-Prorocentrum_minimum.AAC.2
MFTVNETHNVNLDSSRISHLVQHALHHILVLIIVNASSLSRSETRYRLRKHVFDAGGSKNTHLGFSP